jgi:hypothetical protein
MCALRRRSRSPEERPAHHVCGRRVVACRATAATTTTLTDMTVSGPCSPVVAEVPAAAWMPPSPTRTLRGAGDRYTTRARERANVTPRRRVPTQSASNLPTVASVMPL